MLTKKVKIFERLKSENNIDAVFKKGGVIISSDKRLKANYISSNDATRTTRIAITISSKAGNSVWRNRLKRIIRESLKQEKEFFEDRANNNMELSIIFSPYKINQANLKHLFLKDIKPAVTDVLNKLLKTISRN
jgi:ribonuclease P protein component